MSTLEKIRAEIEDAIPWNTEEKAMKQAVLDVIDKYASEECDNDCEHCAYLECPIEPCEDAVSRQHIIEQYKSCADMLSDEELEGANLVMEWVYKAPSVSPQEPCEDAISREAVLDEVNKKFNEINIILENLPSVQPKAKHDVSKIWEVDFKDYKDGSFCI